MRATPSETIILPSPLEVLLVRETDHRINNSLQLVASLLAGIADARSYTAHAEK